jgi:hypothetical protein
VNHDRQLESAYAALITNLPPLIPPYSSARPDLDPGVDRAEVASQFSGRGVGAGMDFFMPVWKEKLGLEGGFNLAVLRGKTDATYRSTTYYYTIFEEDVETVLSPPYVEFEDAESLALIQQRSSDVGVYAPSLSSTASVLEGYVGFRWNAWRGLGIFGGFRSTRYDGVGVELRPETVVTVSGTNSQDLAETERSVTYDGFYGGLSYRF